MTLSLVVNKDMKNICVWNVSHTIFCIWDFFINIEVYVYIYKKILEQRAQAYCPVCICRNIWAKKAQIINEEVWGGIYSVELSPILAL